MHPKLNKRPRAFPFGPVDLGHQGILILNADPALSTYCTNQPLELTSILHLAFIFCNLEGKIRFYLIFNFICYLYQSISTTIKPELNKNILNFGYGINYKYECMLAHSFERFCIVTKFMLPSIEDINFSKLSYDNTCAYLDNKHTHGADTKKHMLVLMTFCKKIEPFVIYYKRFIKSYNHMAHNILENETNLILPQISKKKKWNYHHTGIHVHRFSLLRYTKFPTS